MPGTPVSDCRWIAWLKKRVSNGTLYYDLFLSMTSQVMDSSFPPLKYFGGGSLVIPSIPIR